MLENKQKGFTLIELIVVMTITIILSSLVLANYRDGQKRYALAQSAQQLVSDLRRIQNMAMNGVGITFASNRKGYGIHIHILEGEDETDYYLIYSNNNASWSWQESDEEIETVNLANNVKITDISTPNRKADIYFESPDPTTYIKAPASPNTITITLGMDNLANTETITVTLAGVIQVN